MLDATTLAAYQRAGLTSREIAEEVGLCAASVRRHARKAGSRCTRDTFKTVRQRAEAMRPSEAVVWLIDQLELLADAMCGAADHEVDGWGLTLTHGERRVLIALVDAAPLVATHGQLHAAQLFGGTRDTDPHMVKVLVSRIRKRLPAALGRIVTAHGLGYRFEPRAGHFATLPLCDMTLQTRLRR